MTIQEKLQSLRARIRNAATRSHRQASEIKLVLVTKNVLLPQIKEAFQAGARDFGENRVQELVSKKPELDGSIHWHFIGRLQTNKVKRLLEGADESLLIHSLDRMELAEEIQKQAQKKERTVDALIQVNTTGETTKAGFRPEEVEKTVQQIQKMNRIQLQGFMTIGPLNGSERSIRKNFASLRQIRDELSRSLPVLKELSMGMSSDFEWAVEEGATIVRIGTALFGE